MYLIFFNVGRFIHFYSVFIMYVYQNPLQTCEGKWSQYRVNGLVQGPSSGSDAVV